MNPALRLALTTTTTTIGFLLCGVSLAQPEQPAQPATAQTEVPVKGVVLFSSGVGYFEHFGTVKGDGSTELRFKTAQINDILKSLVLQDLDNGKVNVITYPSQDPIAKTLASFQVNLSGNPPLADLLNQLRGARVAVAVQTEKVEGTILGVEKKQRPVGDKPNPIEISVLNILTGASIRSIPLDDIRNLELQDPQLQDELNKALAALAQARDQDKKPVQISFTGQGERRVRLGYVVETPIWKTSYRLVLSDDEKTKPAIQGWAIVENQTDNDWNNVQLSLVSGRPISFVQDLYQPLYIPRPVVKPELYASLRPQTYDAGMNAPAEAPAEFAKQLGGGGMAGAAPAAPAPMRQRAEQLARRGGSFRDNVLAESAAAAESDEKLAAIDPSASVASVASASKVGELFQYTVGNVTLPRQKSAMIPVVTDDVQVERLSIYNQGVLARNPLTGARVRNTTGKHLLQGPVTVLDGGAYAGDARIDDVPPGQERLLSYGVDQQVIVDPTKVRDDSAIQTGRIVKGVLEVTTKQVFTQDYLNENKADHDKTLLIEHPVRQGWKLVEPAKADETTEQVYRFKGKVPAGKQSKLTVKQEVVTGQQIAILPTDIGQLEFYSRTGEIPKPVRDALVRAVSLKYALVDTQRQIAQRQQRVNEITQEQTRIRENMKTVASNSGYSERLLKKLDEQETRIEGLQKEVATLQQKLQGQQKELEDYLGSLNVG
jgi:hypothetical protein